ncbi:hypothetical protein B0H14DRAFT_2654910 [Mycena olivaceomarginata]|nr:hypothetical protein B0H14DRAFT_2654910 [Mycena olivaceomarginata]
MPIALPSNTAAHATRDDDEGVASIPVWSLLAPTAMERAVAGPAAGLARTDWLPNEMHLQRSARSAEKRDRRESGRWRRRTQREASARGPSPCGAERGGSETRKSAQREEQSAGGERAHEKPQRGEGETEGEGDGEQEKLENSGALKASTVWEMDTTEWPEELRTAVSACKRVRDLGGGSWDFCIEGLIALERAGGFATKSPVPVPQGNKDVRPEEVPSFMRYARKWDKPVPLKSVPGPITVKGSFAERWWDWWSRIQPASRVLPSGKFMSSRFVPVEDWSEVVQMTGKKRYAAICRGSAVVGGRSSSWGGREPGEGVEGCGCGCGECAGNGVVSATYVLIRITDSVAAENDKEAGSVSSTRPKRRQEDAEDKEGDKENAPPK